MAKPVLLLYIPWPKPFLSSQRTPAKSASRTTAASRSRSSLISSKFPPRKGPINQERGKRTNPRRHQPRVPHRQRPIPMLQHGNPRRPRRMQSQLKVCININEGRPMSYILTIASVIPKTILNSATNQKNSRNLFLEWPGQHLKMYIPRLDKMSRLSKR